MVQITMDYLAGLYVDFLLGYTLSCDNLAGYDYTSDVWSGNEGRYHHWAKVKVVTQIAFLSF